MEELEGIIKQNPGYKLLSKQKLIKKIRDEYDIPRDVISDYYDKREINQVFKRPPPQSENKLVITAPPYSFQIDVIMLPAYKTSNKGVSSFLLLVDILSRKAYAYPLKNNTMQEVLDKYEQFLIDVDEQLNSVAGDAFFDNDEFKAFNEELMIQVYTDVAKDDHITRRGDKLGIIDRATRSLKQLINKYMLDNRNLKWTTYLDDIVDAYNETPHAALKGNTPNEVFDDDMLLDAKYKSQRKANQRAFDKYKLEIGDSVRHIVGRLTFEKEKQKYSTEVYTITERVGNRFKLDGVARLYRPNELQRVGEISDRINDETVIAAKDRHKRITRVQRGTDKSYGESNQAITQLETGNYKTRLRSGAKMVDVGTHARLGDRKLRSGKIG